MSAAAAEAGLPLAEWLAQAAEAKIRADGQARILEEAIGASVALPAGPGDRVLTSDPGGLRRLCDAAGNKAVVVGC